MKLYYWGRIKCGNNRVGNKRTIILGFYNHLGQKEEAPSAFVL